MDFEKKNGCASPTILMLEMEGAVVSAVPETRTVIRAGKHTKQEYSEGKWVARGEKNLLLQYAGAHGGPTIYQQHIMDMIENYSLGATVVLEVGPGNKRYGFCAAVLSKASSFFEALLLNPSSAWKECKTIVVKVDQPPVPLLCFPTWDPVAVKVILCHLVNESFVVKMPNEAKNDSDAAIHLLGELASLSLMLGLTKLYKIAIATQVNIYCLYGEAIKKAEEICSADDPTTEEIERLYVYFSELGSKSWRSTTKDVEKAACKAQSPTSLAVVDSTRAVKMSDDHVSTRFKMLMKYVPGFGQGSIDMAYFRNVKRESLFNQIREFRKIGPQNKDDKTEYSTIIEPLFPGMPWAELTITHDSSDGASIFSNLEAILWLPSRFYSAFQAHTAKLTLYFTIQSSYPLPRRSRGTVDRTFTALPKDFKSSPHSSVEDMVCLKSTIAPCNGLRDPEYNVKVLWGWIPLTVDQTTYSLTNQKSFRPRVYVRDFDAKGLRLPGKLVKDQSDKPVYPESCSSDDSSYSSDDSSESSDSSSKSDLLKV